MANRYKQAISRQIALWTVNEPEVKLFVDMALDTQDVFEEAQLIHFTQLVTTIYSKIHDTITYQGDELSSIDKDSLHTYLTEIREALTTLDKVKRYIPNRGNVVRVVNNDNSSDYGTQLFTNKLTLGDMQVRINQQTGTHPLTTYHSPSKLGTHSTEELSTNQEQQHVPHTIQTTTQAQAFCPHTDTVSNQVVNPADPTTCPIPWNMARNEDGINVFNRFNDAGTRRICEQLRYSSRRLTEAEIDTFTGEPEKFLNFWLSYRDTIAVDCVSDSARFECLKRKCSGAARKLIDGYPVTSFGFEQAVQVLFDHYNDDEVVAYAAITKLTKLTRITRDYSDLEEKFGEIRAIVFQLDLRHQANNIVTQNLILDKFPEEIKSELGNHRTEYDVWNTSQMLTCLAKIVRTKARSYRLCTLKYEADAAAIPCIFCNTIGHRPMTCKHLNGDPDTLKCVITHRRCLVCIEVGHETAHCPNGSCAQCGSLHHTVFCELIMLKNAHREQDTLFQPSEPSFRHEHITRYSNHSTGNEQVSILCPQGQMGHTHTVRTYNSQSRLDSTKEHVKMTNEDNNDEDIEEKDRPNEEDNAVSDVVGDIVSEVGHNILLGTHLTQTLTKVSSTPVENINTTIVTQQRQDVQSKRHIQMPILRLLVCCPTDDLPNVSGQNPQVPSLTIDCLMDSGATATFITAKTAEKLKLPVVGSKSMTVLTFPKKATQVECKIVTLDIPQLGVHNVYVTADLGQHTVDALTDSDIQNVNKNGVQLQHNPYQRHLVEADLLMGQDLLSTVYDLSKLPLQLPSGLVVNFTKFGPVLSGKKTTYPLKRDGPNTTQPSHIFESPYTKYGSHDEFQEIVLQVAMGKEYSGTEDPWSLEGIGICDDSPTTATAGLEQDVLKHFMDTTEIVNERITVRLPWKTSDPRLLPTNYGLARNRTIQALARFRKDVEKLREYHATFQQQLQSGIIEMVQPLFGYPSIKNPTQLHYLAHQPVFKDSTTTKLRVVYDGSAHYSNKPSINDKLHAGPLLLPNLTGTLIRSRVYKNVLIADIEKAFHQIALHPEDQDSVRFLWFKETVLQQILNKTLDINSFQPQRSDFVEYRFKRVPFGLTCSPFLLGASIHMYVRKSTIAEGDKDHILRDMYVDNLLMGCTDANAVLQHYRDSKEVFTNMNMNLREYSTNLSQTQVCIPQEDRNDSRSQKFLGVRWDLDADTYSIPVKFQQRELTNKMTKAEVYSANASNYDPLGLAYPLLLEHKKFGQGLWGEGRRWNTKLRKSEQEHWNSLCTTVSDELVTLPRKTLDNSQSCALTVFSNASKHAYATCIYLQNILPDGSYSTPVLLCSKGRLNPIRNSLTQARSELVAIQIGVQLAEKVVGEMEDEILLSEIKFFTDSHIAIEQVSKTVTNKDTFVRNRVRTIRETFTRLGVITKTTLHYVPVSINPSGMGSKGASLLTMSKNGWFTGPEFLQNKRGDWEPTLKKEWPVPPEGTIEICEPKFPSIRVVQVQKRKTRKRVDKTSEPNVPVPSTPLLPLTNFETLRKALLIAGELLKSDPKLQETTDKRLLTETLSQGTHKSSDLQTALLLLMLENQKTLSAELAKLQVKGNSPDTSPDPKTTPPRENTPARKARAGKKPTATVTRPKKTPIRAKGVRPRSKPDNGEQTKGEGTQ